MNKIIMVEIPQTVNIRKYNVDIEALKQCLRQHKNITNKEISTKLGVPITKVEHWFRKDKHFAIPDSDIWFALKELLNITTNEFDESVMTFIEKENTYEKANRCYLDIGIAPTITCENDIKIIIT